MSLLSIRREYWREKPGSVEDQILRHAGFDDIAPIAIYLHADCEYVNQMLKAFRRLKKACKDVSKIQELTLAGLREGETEGVDFGHLYNRLYEMIAEDFGDIGVDKYGAWGHEDAGGDWHFGDDRGFFPWYLDEETLRKNLVKWNQGCN